MPRSISFFPPSERKAWSILPSRVVECPTIWPEALMRNAQPTLAAEGAEVFHSGGAVVKKGVRFAVGGLRDARDLSAGVDTGSNVPGTSEDADIL